MDIHLGLFSERLRRLLADEEVMVPEPIKQYIQNLQADVEIVASCLRDYQYDFLWLTFQLMLKIDPIDCPILKVIMEEINFFVRECDNIIDTFIIAINQQNSQSYSTDISDALLPRQRKIIDIKKQLQQVPHNIPSGIMDWFKSFQSCGKIFPASSSIKNRDIIGLDDRMEEFLDILIEGPPQLLMVAIIEVDKTAFTAKAYHNNYVKHYFDCHAWVLMPDFFYPKEILDSIMKSVVPLDKLREVSDENREMKKMILQNYLMNKRYLFVLDNVLDSTVWDEIQEILPDNHNGSRVVILVYNARLLTSFQLENGENIQYDFVPARGQLKVTYRGRPFLILCLESMSLNEYYTKTVYEPRVEKLVAISMFPLYLRSCCLYLSLFYTHLEIPTRELYQLWIAEGFIPNNNEATAEEYLDELFDKGFIQVRKKRPDGTIKTFSILPSPWFALSMLSPVLEFSITYFLFLFDNLGPDYNRWERIKRCASLESLNFDNLAPGVLNPNLHSLLLSSQRDYTQPIDWESISKNFKFLKVLDLGFLVLNQYPFGIENLFLLRYLKLNIPSLKSLPSSLLSNLLNLYTLDMPSSYIDHTPDDFWKMWKLRHLNFGLIKLPAHPGNYCRSLENINFISSLHPSCCTPDIMSRLPNLIDLKISGDFNYYQSLLSKSLCSLSCLESLKLVNQSDKPKPSKIVLLDYQLPPSLAKLSFSNMELLDDLMPALEKLPHLQVLKLKQNTYLGRKLTCSNNGFPKLKVLHLKSMFWLEEWTMEIRAMPRLECLIINPCGYLKKLPEQLWCRQSFKKLETWWPQSELRQTLQNLRDKEQYDIQIYPYGM